MTTLAYRIAGDLREIFSSPAAVSAGLLGDKFRELDNIVLAYVEGRTSAEEVRHALEVRSMLANYLCTTMPRGGEGERKVVMNAIRSSYLLEIVQILVISERRFGTRKGMTHILADKFLADRFHQDERDEIRRIANTAFFAHEKMMKLVCAVQARYASLEPQPLAIGAIDDEINKLDLRPIIMDRKGNRR